ncbi:MAG TPA: GNAT family N-acetyltransferase [Candidatus Limnocylindrales bacterium]|jgi:mycothiol synthase|nr:GNAT family N-acetyltransferase [Candidatus Limnocylindrales bacterium]
MSATTSSTNSTWLELAETPNIEGVRFRRPRGDDADYDAMAAVITVACREDGVPWAPTGAHRREELEGAEGIDLDRDMVVTEIDGSVIGESGVQRRTRGGVPVYDIWGSVHPAYRRRGLGRALLHENLRRIAERMATGEDGDLEPRIRGFAEESEVGHRVLLESECFTPARWFFLMIRRTLDDIPEAPLPDGLEIRPVLPEHHRAIFDAEHEAFLDHWMPRDHNEADFVSLFSRAALDTDLWVVAWDGDEVAGVVQNWIWPEENTTLGVARGWLEHISVRRAWRRRGLGRAITAEALRRLRAAGMTDAALGVDADNPTGALGLYEGLGFEVDQRSTAYWGPLPG